MSLKGQDKDLPGAGFGKWLPTDTISQNKNRHPDTAFSSHLTLLPDDSLEEKTEELYDTLKNRADKRKITRRIFRLIVVDTDTLRNDKQNPNNENLELYRDKIIRSITFRQLNVFGQEIYDTNSKPLRIYEKAGNKIHFNTSKRILTKNLLFKSGDKVDPLILADNERLLRQLPYIEDARIIVRKLDSDTDSVDVVVITKDVWPLGLGLEIADFQSGNFGIWNRNIFGLGRGLENTISWDTDKKPLLGYEGVYRINNISGTFINSEFRYMDRYGTRLFNASFQREFLTPETKYAGGFRFERRHSQTNIEVRDSIITNALTNSKLYDAWLGRAFLINNKNYLLQRRTNIMIACRFFNIKYNDRPAVDKNILYDYHNRKLILGSLGIADQRFVKSYLIYGFGQTEDIPYGFLMQFTSGYEFNEFGNRPYFGIVISRANFIGKKKGYIFNSLQFGGFKSNNIIEQGTFSIKSNYFTALYAYNRFKFRYFINTNYTYGFNRTTDEFVTIENREGIHGLKSDLLKGTQKLTLNVEAVAYTPYYYNGFRFVFFGFTDIGFIGPSDESIFNNNLYAGLGLGIRIRNERLVFNTLQIKFALYPFVPNDAKWQFIQVSGEQKSKFNNFFISQPSIIDF